MCVHNGSATRVLAHSPFELLADAASLAAYSTVRLVLAEWWRFATSAPAIALAEWWRFATSAPAIECEVEVARVFNSLLEMAGAADHTSPISKHVPLNQHQQQQKQTQSFAASYVRCSAARSIFGWTASIFTGHCLYKMAYTPCTCHFDKGESHATSEGNDVTLSNKFSINWILSDIQVLLHCQQH